MENHKAAKPAFNVGPPSVHQRDAIKWRYGGRLMMAHWIDPLPHSSTTKKPRQSWGGPPLKKRVIYKNNCYNHAIFYTRVWGGGGGGGIDIWLLCLVILGVVPLFKEYHHYVSITVSLWIIPLPIFLPDIVLERLAILPTCTWYGWFWNPPPNQIISLFPCTFLKDKKCIQCSCVLLHAF